MDDNRLGEFLRARREQVDPGAVGLPRAGRRRTPGLRRDELAFLAGVSSYYYARLEQGRDRNPSSAVLDALARVLQLDEQASLHLHGLTGPVPSRRRRVKPETISPELGSMMDGWTSHAAVIVGRFRDVLAATQLATLLNPGFAVGQNLLRSTFLDPGARDVYPDWETVAAGSVAGLRASAGLDLDDPRLTALVGELSLKSDDFRRLWARHDVHEKTSGTKRFGNPMVGPLDLSYVSFTVNGAEGQSLHVFFPSPGSPAEQALALLSTLSTPAVTSAPRAQEKKA
ncbi:helix-turn-helix transcriptional regulator [Kineosporia sp. NBRC 101731]|uniref:helix-turn-helix domain-containing protein n=1 Tax=Kineosporia sp. NBRC 101731 TaxID=3032199 RepID=UPI00249FBA6E|nr:helix-turn-helix transcriptional regulator [Kineosporia sp. NBRC 101731]GLY28146.1 transcriptional regulator [Kineosporia sp. NBRC 101731]